MSEPSRKTVSKLLVETVPSGCGRITKSLAPMTVQFVVPNRFMVSADCRCRRPAAAEARTHRRLGTTGQDLVLQTLEDYHGKFEQFEYGHGGDLAVSVHW